MYLRNHSKDGGADRSLLLPALYSLYQSLAVTQWHVSWHGINRIRRAAGFVGCG